ncbi:hypothetical protein [Bradyrhizobium sp.]|uniref:hypothetical protein n=1 Tax=Bradyrhizobium sp. TaxID=376 RepID=UPI0039E4A651
MRAGSLFFVLGLGNMEFAHDSGLIAAPCLQAYAFCVHAMKEGDPRNGPSFSNARKIEAGILVPA